MVGMEEVNLMIREWLTFFLLFHQPCDLIAALLRVLAADDNEMEVPDIRGDLI